MPKTIGYPDAKWRGIQMAIKYLTVVLAAVALAVSAAVGVSAVAPKEAGGTVAVRTCNRR